MSVGLYVRSFFGFALQLVPCAILLLIPFRDKAFEIGKKRAYMLLALLSLGFSLCFPLNVWWSNRLPADSTLDDNLFMLLAVAGVTALFMRLTRENLTRKFTVLFIVIRYADWPRRHPTANMSRFSRNPKGCS